jgi:hypothetical protein
MAVNAISRSGLEANVTACRDAVIARLPPSRSPALHGNACGRLPPARGRHRSPAHGGLCCQEGVLAWPGDLEIDRGGL